RYGLLPPLLFRRKADVTGIRLIFPEVEGDVFRARVAGLDLEGALHGVAAFVPDRQGIGAGREAAELEASVGPGDREERMFDDADPDPLPGMHVVFDLQQPFGG